jgi:hypothetical protein
VSFTHADEGDLAGDSEEAPVSLGILEQAVVVDAPPRP